MGTGYLVVRTSMAGSAAPVEGAYVVIKDMDGAVLFNRQTDASGEAGPVPLPAPDKVYTLDPDYKRVPYSLYQVEVSAPGLTVERVEGVQILDTVASVQEIDMRPALRSENPVHLIKIPPHKQILRPPWDQRGPREPSRARILPEVIIPDSITVHLGRYNVSARNIRVPFPLYIKNVTSSEIYATWPEASLEANIRAIINFALNRVYTEWYRVRGYPFDITSSTTTDMYFVEGRNIYENISAIVDRLMGEYLHRTGHREPFFTEFCDGRTASCPGMTQWGTVTLAERGYNPMQILHHYYPSDLIIATAPIATISESFPGVALTEGTQGPDVERMQRFLNRIRQNYPAIPVIANPNSVFTAETANAVRTFQRVFSLPQTGIIDRAAWNSISRLYGAVTKLSELTSEGDKIVTGTLPPNTTVRMGMTGGLVARLQFMLNFLTQFYPEIPALTQDGSFGSGTRAAVVAFQNRFSLSPDGVVGPATWAKLYEVYFAAKEVVPPVSPPVQPPIVTPPGGPVYPGAPLRVGSRGESVRIMQEYLNVLSNKFPTIERLVVDGIFGPATERAVMAFQRQFNLTIDGIIGPSTWAAIVAERDVIAGETPAGPSFPGTLLRVGSRGEDVRLMQQYLNALAAIYPTIPRLTADGVFGPITQSAVVAFQRLFGLTADGIIGPVTWNAIVNRYYALVPRGEQILHEPVPDAIPLPAMEETTDCEALTLFSHVKPPQEGD